MAPIPCSVEGCNQTFRDDLDATILLSLIEVHIRTSHPPTTPLQVQAPSAKAEKVRRPTVTTSGSSEDWAYFTSRWQEYKLATRLQGHDVIWQLLECCEESLRKDLNRTHGTLAGETEENALKFVKTLAVKPENVMVARVQLQNIRQDRDETVRAFCARLRGQAGVCKFTKSKTCACNQEVEVDYSDDIVRDTLIRGLADEDIRLDILGQCRQDISLEETLQMVEAKESGKRSANILTNPTVSSNATSSYMRSFSQPKFNQQKQSVLPKERETNPSVCSHCGKKGHGNGRNRYARVANCPAYNHTCARCGKRHHFETECRASQHENQTQYSKKDTTTHDAVFNEAEYDNSGFFNEESDKLCATSDM